MCDEEGDLMENENVNPEEEKSEKLLKLPLARVKHLIKMDPDVHLASQEAVFLIAKATVSFISIPFCNS